MGKKFDTLLQGDTAREVCERANRQVVLAGSVSTIGSEYLLTLEALDCASGKKLGAAKSRAGSEEAVFSALDRLTDQVRTQLGESAKSVQSFEVPIAEATTPSLEALKAYSIATTMEAQGSSETDILPLLQRAVTIDPNFAMAYSSMGTQYYNLSEFKLASQAYSKAFALSGRVSAHEKLDIEARYYAEGQQDLEQGIEVYKTWAATYPNDWIPWNHLADVYTRTGQYEAAIEAGQRALELEPDRAINYSVLMRAYKRAGRYNEAKALAATAIRRGKASSGLHGLLYVIAWQQHDTEALKQEARLGEDESWYGYYLEALAAASEGRYGQSSALFHHAVEQANEDNVGENADLMLTDEAAIELQFGLKSEARKTLARIGEADRDMEELVNVRAMMGDEAPAEAFLRAHQDQAGTGTILTYLKLPQLRAQLALLHGKPEAAVAALESAKPYEMAGYDIPSLRGEAYLRAHQPELAAAEYRKVLDNPGVSFGPLYPMAHLGLARAYAAMGKTPESRAEYQSFLAAWKDADPNLPLLQTAQAELAHLR
jgi:tetratricopeptide (TPR) repeat protein